MPRANADRVVVRIARDPALVRTVRLVAGALVRRAGAEAAFAEEIRLAVGEACALMIGEDGQAADGGEPVVITLAVGEQLLVEVTSPVPVVVSDPIHADVDGVERWALLRGMVDSFQVAESTGGTTISMSWSMA